MIIPLDRLLSFFLCFFCANVMFAQIDVQDVAAPPYDPVSLIYNELLGEGVQIVDINYEGANSSVGFFSNAKNQVGIESGVLLTTGAVRTVGANVGVDQIGSVEASVDNGSIIQDADMTALADFSLFNVSKYTITFIPSSDSIQFRYVFASEEYPEFVCSDYNDIFGFFISGPGINGVYENNAENIATIPGTTLPVKINNVNSGQVGDEGVASNCQNGNGYLNFSQFYVDNEGSSNEPVFDGFTKVFTASAKVIPCESYTIKLVVADQGDPQRDSGVFLEAKSFSSESITVDVLTESIDGTIIEGCTDASIVINLASPATSDINLDVQLGGNAIEGTDFPSLPPVIIPAGQSSTTISLSATEDGVAEGLEEILFDVQINQCFRDTFSLLINDNLIPTPALGNDTMVCQGTTIQLDGNVLDNLPEPTTFNSSSNDVAIRSPRPGGTPTEIVVPLEVFGIQPLQLKEGLLQSVCLDIEHKRLQDLLVYLEAPGGQLIPLSTRKGGTEGNYTNTCFSPDATQSIREGSAPFSNTYSPEGNWSNLWSGNSPTNGIWNLRISDESFGFNGILKSWSITLNPVVSYSYEWKNAPGLSCTDCPNPTVTPTESTDYIIEVTDNHACVSSDTFRVTIPEEINNNPVITCTDQSYTSLSFSWEDIVAATAYEVKVNAADWVLLSRDSNAYTITNLSLNEEVQFAVRAIGGCNSTEQTTSCSTLGCQPIQLEQEAVQMPACNGGSDGRIQVKAVGDNGTFTYFLLSNGESNNTGLFENVEAGNYTIEVLDEWGCSNPFEITVPEPDPIAAAAIVVTDLLCIGDNGSGAAIVSGGTPPYTYNWDNGQTDSVFTTNTQGLYTVMIIDANGCEATDAVPIAEPAQLSTTKSAMPTCVDQAMGEATIEGIGGTGNFTYLWDANANNQTTATATNLDAGLYFVTATDENACSIVDSVEVLALDTLSTPTVSCNDITNNSITFVWTDDPNANGFEININNTNWISPTEPLAHQITGLSLGESVSIQVRGIGDCTPPIGTTTCTTLDCMPIEIDTTLSPISCNGLSDGMVAAVATGGQGDFQYTIGDATNTTGIFEQLAAGNYLVNVEDAFGCVASVSITLQEPAPLAVDITIDSHQTCNGLGGLTAAPTGGSEPYQIAWNNSETTLSVEDLAAGDYSITITDANNCTATAMSTINGQDAIAISISAIDASCQEANGMATVTTEGNADYTYIWSDPAQQTTAVAIGLTAGVYYVTATDGDGCTAIDSIELSTTDMLATPALSCTDITNSSITFVWTDDPNANGFEININNTDWISPTESLVHQVTGLTLGESVTLQVRGIGDCPPPIATTTCTTLDCMPIDLDTTLVHVSCNGLTDGAVTAIATGGQGSFQYTVGDATNTTGIFEQLAAGSYLLNVEDEFGCVASTSINIQEPTELVATILIDSHQSCNGLGGLTVETSGGTSPYRIGWSTMDTLVSIENLNAGDYSVTITDANNCMVNATATINGQDALTTDITKEDASCNEADGTASIMVAGGAADYSYQWNDPLQQTGATATNLTAGIYEVIVTDADNCTALASVTINTPSTIVIDSIVALDPRCADTQNGEATIYTDAANLDYTWSNGNSTSAASNLAAGTYTVTIQEAGGCSLIETVTLTAPSFIEATSTTEDIACSTEANGEIMMNVSGGMAPYQFSWNNNATTQQVENLTAGDYTVTITDANNCTLEHAATIETSTDLIIELSSSPINCANSNDGIIDAQITGGTTPYEYNWSTGASDNRIDNLAAGTYALTIVDANGCSSSQSTDLAPVGLANITSAVSQPLCWEDAGSIDLEVADMAAPFQVLINGVSRGENTLISNLDAGNYVVEIVDANDCLYRMDTVVIDATAPIQIELDAIPKLQPGDARELTPQVTGGTAPYTFTWESMQPNSLSCTECEAPTIQPLSSTSYQLAVLDANGCSESIALTAIVSKERKIYAPTVFSPNRDGINDRFTLYGQGDEIELLRIFDRWGNLVFEKSNLSLNDETVGWDGVFNGQTMNSNVFIWFAQVRFSDGEVELVEGEISIVE